VTADALHEEAVKIALAYLEQSGTCTAHDAFGYVGRHVAYQIEQGTSSRLMLSNRAISAYLRHCEQSNLQTEPHA
jgi:hypothetical protein